MATNEEIFQAIGEMKSDIRNLSEDMTEVKSMARGHENLKNQLIGVWAVIALLGTICSDYIKSKIGIGG